MRFLSCLLFLGLVALTSARSFQHAGKALPKVSTKITRDLPSSSTPRNPRRAAYYNSKTEPFLVNGTSIPHVNFDIGESYAGLIPISSATNETSKLYFWFFPSSNPSASDEITIWLNGGPGCSSLEGVLQENGPFTWQFGTVGPVPNPYTWVNLTNMLYVEQPVGTGYSQGTPTATSETDVAFQFLGFFKNFVDTFDLQNRKVFITGESYAGMYVPYIADAMFNANDTKYYDLQATMIYDPIASTQSIHDQVPLVAFVDYWSGLLNLNASFSADIHKRADSCGYTSFLSEYLVFPPKGPLPEPPDPMALGCDIFDSVINAVSLVNPCFNIYQVATTCPPIYNPLYFPGSSGYLPACGSSYFNRKDVKQAINAPDVDWVECRSTGIFINDTDNSPPSGLSVLPSVIERSKRTVIGHGLLDMLLISNGTLLMIQNMTWNGAQGFTSKPSDKFFVPYHSESSNLTVAGSGIFGTTHTERGLTWVEVALSGHMIPQYAPSAAYRQLEFLLGRIDSLTEKGSFTTQRGDLKG